MRWSFGDMDGGGHIDEKVRVGLRNQENLLGGEQDCCETAVLYYCNGRLKCFTAMGLHSKWPPPRMEATPMGSRAGRSW